MQNVLSYHLPAATNELLGLSHDIGALEHDGCPRAISKKIFRARSHAVLGKAAVSVLERIARNACILATIRGGHLLGHKRQYTAMITVQGKTHTPGSVLSSQNYTCVAQQALPCNSLLVRKLSCRLLSTWLNKADSQSHSTDPFWGAHLRMRRSQSASWYFAQPTLMRSQALFHSPSAAASFPCAQYNAASAARMSADPGALRATLCISRTAALGASSSSASISAALEAANTAPAPGSRNCDTLGSLIHPLSSTAHSRVRALLLL